MNGGGTKGVKVGLRCK